jgi:hypothetical protein
MDMYPRMYLNPHVLEYIGVELKLIYTPIDLNTVDWDEYESIQTSP